MMRKELWLCLLVVVRAVYVKDVIYSVEELRSHSCRHRVYLYNLSNTIFWDAKEVSFRKAWYSDAQSGMKNTEQWSASLMMVDRIRRSKCRVYNPQKADIFMIPALPYHKLDKEWRKICANITESQFLSAVPYITEENACRHFIFFAKTHRACTTGKWYYHPEDTRIRSMLRLAHDSPLPHHSANLSSYELYPYFYRTKHNGSLDRCRGDAGADRFGRKGLLDCSSTFPHVYSVPYPSSLHWRRFDSFSQMQITPLSTLKKPRKRLMVFVGHIDKGGGRALRKRIDTMGKNYNNEYIYYRPPTVTLNEFISLFQEATFCLQPGGDSPGRKSISDAVALGCIPVFFGNVSASQYSWFYSTEAHLDIDLDLFMEGKIDLKTHLEAISMSRLYKMRKALVKVRKAFTYNIDDNAGAGDAVDRILDLVDHHARSSARCHSFF